MHKIILFLVLIISSASAIASKSEDRKQFLDAIRPEATRKAGQPIRFKVLQLNFDSGWAVLVGGLVAEEGKVMDWTKASECDPDLDKLLWVVAQRQEGKWKVREMFICSPEPPYWNLHAKDFSRPCGIYAGLEISGSETAEDQCKAFVKRRRRQRQ